MDKLYFYERFSRMLGISIMFYQKKTATICEQEGEKVSLLQSKQLLEKLISQADQKQVPVVYQDEFQVLWGCIKKEDTYCIFGPMALRTLSKVEVHRFYQFYNAGDKKENEKVSVPVFSMQQSLLAVQLITNEFTGAEYSADQLLQANILEQETEKKKEELIRFQLTEEAEEMYHHTYQEERRLLDCVREGDVEKALYYNMNIDEGTGKLSRKEVTQWKNVLIVSVTLCTRAAIEGGLSPSIAYQLSDFYIQKSEQYHTVAELIECRNKAVREFTERVRKRREMKSSSNYVERCKDYVSKHYKEKIYLGDIADALGLSESYLSRLFSKETGMRLQDYINWFRVERAANLLIYSSVSISEIGDYVNFPTQSYFGKMFKKYKNMTPGEYRNMYKPSEFSTDVQKE